MLDGTGGIQSFGPPEQVRAESPWLQEAGIECRWRCGDLRGGWVPKGPHVSRYHAAATGMLCFECTLKPNGRVEVMVLWYGGCKPGKIYIDASGMR